MVRKLEVKNLVINSLLEVEKNNCLKISLIFKNILMKFLNEKRRNGLCQSKYLNRSLAEYKNIA
ncbi:hypothetical protein JMUB3936_2108 [Leptotrichia wadei]|uniref:Uncharacterized protein n=1 Tax=Leptotrichia wadei TaxID=157687 RepID=A0A510KYD5_9FUSO|nr:hypothetical protein JMUB3936_2108 [Leptotrichia wadei]